MKRILILIVLTVLILTVSSVSFAQTSITINPFGAIFGFYDGQYEIELSKNSGLIIGGMFFNYELGDVNLTGFGGRLGLRAYPTGEFSGLFLQGHGGINKVSVTGGGYDGTGTSMNVGGQAGFK